MNHGFTLAACGTLAPCSKSPYAVWSVGFVQDGPHSEVPLRNLGPYTRLRL